MYAKFCEILKLGWVRGWGGVPQNFGYIRHFEQIFAYLREMLVWQTAFWVFRRPAAQICVFHKNTTHSWHPFGCLGIPGPPRFAYLVMMWLTQTSIWVFREPQDQICAFDVNLNRLWYTDSHYFAYLGILNSDLRIPSECVSHSHPFGYLGTSSPGFLKQYATKTSVWVFRETT